MKIFKLHAILFIIAQFYLLLLENLNSVNGDFFSSVDALLKLFDLNVEILPHLKEFGNQFEHDSDLFAR